MDKLRPQYVIAFVALLMGISVAFSGQQFFPDEYGSYVSTHQLTVLLGRIFSGETVANVFTIDHWQSFLKSPLYILLSVPVELLNFWCRGQAVSNDLLIDRSWFSTHAMFNALVFGFNCLCIYWLSKRLFDNDKMAWLAQVFYLFWPQHLIYVRHLLPYLLSEALFLASLVFLFKAFEADKQSRAKMFLYSGLCWAVHLFTYMGFFYTGLIYLAMFVWQGLKQKDWQAGFVPFCWFILPTVVVFTGMDLLNRYFYDASYIQFLMSYSRSITHGEFTEALMFPIDYGLTVAPVVFCVLLAGLLYGLVQGQSKNARLVSLSVCSLLFFLMINAIIFEHMVVYARVLLPLFAIMSLVAGWAIVDLIQDRDHQKIVINVLPVFLILSLLPFYSGFYALKYPHDQKAHFEASSGAHLPFVFLHSNRTPDGSMRVFHMPTNMPKMFEGPLMVSSDPMLVNEGAIRALDRRKGWHHLLQLRTVTTDKASTVVPLSCKMINSLFPDNRLTLPQNNLYVVMNQEYVYPLGKIEKPMTELFSTALMMYNQPHPFHFAPYLFEGFDAAERERLQNANIRMVTLKNPCRRF